MPPCHWFYGTSKTMTAARHTRAIPPPLLLLVIACLSPPGCAPKTVEVWAPPLQVRWDDVTSATITPAGDQYAILESNASEGRFPCSIAVSRIAIEADEEAGQRRRVVPVTPHNEFLIWNSSFDDLWLISEVFPIAQRALGGAAVEARLIVDAAYTFDARMSLIYGFNVVSPTRCEMLGVLHESSTGAPIAAIHASAESIPRLEKDKPAKHNLDAWEHEARALVRAKFEKLMIDCMRELIARDTAVQIDVPEGWTPIRPMYPLEWPPRPSQ